MDDREKMEYNNRIQGMTNAYPGNYNGAGIVGDTVTRPYLTVAQLTEESIKAMQELNAELSGLCDRIQGSQPEVDNAKCASNPDTSLMNRTQILSQLIQDAAAKVRRIGGAL